VKGIILAGGTGTRLSPLTDVISKQLLPVYDKPMIYYPLSTLMAAQIRKVALISSSENLPLYEKLLGNGKKWGMEISYLVQNEPRGIAEAYVIAEDFLEGENIALILGDNIFVGPGMGRGLRKHHMINGAHVLLYPVRNPQDYGIAEIKSDGTVISLVEKPKETRSRLALTGLIFSDNRAIEYAKTIKPSLRNELEITDLLGKYMENRELKATTLDRGTAWLDMGQTSDLFAASEFVKVVQERQGLKVAAPEEIAWRNNWIDDAMLQNLGESHLNKDYGNYLRSLTSYESYD
jgi:glucose-1-phosphate thymidylyltransferase